MQKKTNFCCPSCKQIVPCEVVSRSEARLKGGQRWQSRDFPDIQWFERVRSCSNCGHRFTTVELSHDFVAELVALREYCLSVDLEAKAIPVAMDQIREALESVDGTMRFIGNRSRSIEARLEKARLSRDSKK
jgi:transcriptional regulator NrdR family protein